jgi:hypothetical protein
MKRSFILLVAVAAAGVVAVVGSAQANPRSGALHVTKECSNYHGAVGEFCTITASNIRAIEPEMKVVYLAPLVNGVLDSDIVLSSERGSAAFGHVVLNLGTAQGRVTFSGGTGKFSHFQADAVVSADSKGLWHWDGTYSFTAAEDDD